MKIKNAKNIITIALVIGFFLIISCIFFVFYPHIKEFIGGVENKTFDLRQQIISKYKVPNNDIVILSVDDPSYEYIVSTHGAWPVPRDFWAYLANNIEAFNPRAIVFDLLFVQNFKAFGNTDKALIDTVISNKNIYVSMNFDNQSAQRRIPSKLSDELKIKINGNTSFLKKIDNINYKNVRNILKEIMDGTSNIGFINIQRSEDGINRTNIPIFVYNNDFYKHLTLSVAMDLIGADNLTLKGHNLVFPDGRFIPLSDDGMAYLNWYGKMGTYKYVPVWRVDKAIKEHDTKYLKEAFENKIVYVGTTTSSLSDIKSTPLDRKYPGVEIHATFLNNILDNNFIKKVNTAANAIITIFLICLVGIIIYRSKSVYWAIFSVFCTIVAYSLLTVLLMHYFNLWVALIAPVAAMIATVTVSYAVKYIITSRDYEHTYKLAVTDGLTDMFNHRYFQEQMKLNIENSKRYNIPFSLIMVDIDFFKKFNDKYGHQSGDAVLRQVAQTIKKNIRVTDIPCRYGGEEMSVILTNTKKEEAAVVAQKICEAVREKEFELATGDWTHVTISVGVASMPENSDNVQGLIEYADKCLYVAKANGRNQVVYSIGEN